MPAWVLKIIDIEQAEKETSGRFSCRTCPHGFVIVAATAHEARETASDHHNNEEDWWLDETITTCEPFETDGETQIILGNYPTG